jgi:hypothetical protein
MAMLPWPEPCTVGAGHEASLSFQVCDLRWLSFLSMSQAGTSGADLSTPEEQSTTGTKQQPNTHTIICDKVGIKNGAKRPSEAVR